MKKTTNAGRAPRKATTAESSVSVLSRHGEDDNYILLVEERRSLILNHLREHGRVTVRDLSERFHTSEVTIRNDLKDLQTRGQLKRSHGGAVNAPHLIQESSLRDRLEKNSDQKRRIGLAAAALVQEGETIILDSGTTTQEIARNLRNKTGLQVITNGVNVAMELLGVRGMQLVVLGGTLRDDSLSMVGHFAESMLEQFSADKLFLGAVACDLHFGVCTPQLAEARVNQAMVRIAKEKILVADSGKFNRRSLCRILMFKDLDKVITDRDLPVAMQDEIRAQGPELILV